jgi:hypothetical protein
MTKVFLRAMPQINAPLLSVPEVMMTDLRIAMKAVQLFASAICVKLIIISVR